MKYLVGIPCLYGAGHTKEAIESVVNYEDVDLLLIDNGAEADVKDVILKYERKYKNVFVIHNKENIYVNPAWNQLIKHFLESDSDCLLIMNSDLVLHEYWYAILEEHYCDSPNDIPVPVISNDKSILEYKKHIPENKEEVFEGAPGVLIALNKEQAKAIYPIPETIKVWFGDNWIYEGLRKLGYKTVILKNLLTYHSGSQNVSKVPGISEIIEQDKIEWAKLK